MTPTLESALSGLPAKPRVHELSKRIGISNKELLAALADRGLTISSASSSVPLAVAQELIESLLGGPAADAVAPDAAEPIEVQSPAGPSAADIPGDTPGQSGHAINPLFLPPADLGGVEQQQGRVDVDQDAPESDTGPSGRSGSSRRRRGRSGGNRRPARENATDSTDSGRSDTDAADNGASISTESADRSVGAVGGEVDDQSVTGIDTSADHPHEDVASAGAPFAGAAAEGGDTAGDPDDGQADGPQSDGDGDEESGSRGRRRRRGRRGRGRVSDADERSDDQGSEDAAAQDEPTTRDEPSAQDDQVTGSSDTGDAPAEEADDESDEDSDTGSGSTAGNRRRRRRRRRSTGDETPREDDPDNTVVHVREPRLSQAGSSTGSANGPSNEVQGVRGSTRLEAKRQRRRDSRDSSRRRPQILTEAEFLARRESVERVMAVRQRGDLAQVALLEDGILVEHFVSQTGSDSMIGSVFLGKVQNVLPSMEAAFCDIGRGRNAVIYAGEVNWDAAGLNGKARRIETALSSGDTILAQVSKDPVGHKGARLTTQISLPGRFVVYVPGGGATGISRKLPDTERKRLKSIMDRIVPEDAGVIIRTAAEGIAEEELARDVERLKSQWDEITRRAAEKTSAPTQLYAEPGTLIKVIRDLFNSDITRLVIDGDDAYEPVAEYITAVAPELADRLVKYETNRPGGPDVFAAYRIDEQIAKALERKVHLPSGGSLVIDRTEAMTVVDVNTGKYTGSGGNLEETVTKNNLEAAEEMVRQLRLRDIGGIIVIDFIDMVLESNRELVLRRLTEALGRDRTRHQVAEVTSLGLVQMTRKRMGTGLVEAFSEPCPHCGGRGLVLHDLPVVASPTEDNFNDRRSGKSGRRRGRDTDRVEEIVIPRVVEPVGRRPDPRGPKPPTTAGGGDRNASGGREFDDAIDVPAAVQPTGDQGPSTGETGELDWIEAAATAGIQAAEDADEDGFEAHHPGSGDGPDEDGAFEVQEFAAALVEAPFVANAVLDGEVVDGADDGDANVDHSGGDGAAVDRVEGAGQDAVGRDVGPQEFAGPDSDVSGQAAPESYGETEANVAPTPERRRRGRRSAGRPAGAPPAAQPVDIIIRAAVPQPTEPQPTEPQPTEPRPGEVTDDSSTNGHEDHAAHGNGNGNGNGETVEPQATKAAPPRRRRAASRPAGPAVGAMAAEPVVISLPAEQPVS